MKEKLIFTLYCFTYTTLSLEKPQYSVFKINYLSMLINTEYKDHTVYYIIKTLKLSLFQIRKNVGFINCFGPIISLFERSFNK